MKLNKLMTMTLGLGLMVGASNADAAATRKAKDGNRAERVAKMFLKIDANNDGVLSLDEMSAAKRARFENRGERTKKNRADKRAKTMSEARMQKRAAMKAEHMAKLDLDGDGQVSKHERLVRHEMRTREMFERADVDASGTLTVQELMAAKKTRAQARKAKKQGKRGPGKAQKAKKAKEAKKAKRTEKTAAKASRLQRRAERRAERTRTANSPTARRAEHALDSLNREASVSTPTNPGRPYNRIDRIVSPQASLLSKMNQVEVGTSRDLVRSRIIL